MRPKCHLLQYIQLSDPTALMATVWQHNSAFPKRWCLPANPQVTTQNTNVSTSQ